MLTTSANGARLAYVVVDLHQSVGTVKRPVTTWTKKDGLKTKMVEEPAGYLVYFPRGHVIRCKDKETLRQYGLDGMPPIINLYDDAEFVFNTNHDFLGRFNGEPDYFAPKDEQDGLLLKTNFVADAVDLPLISAKERGAGGGHIRFSMAKGSMNSHISQFATATYKKGHRHGPGSRLDAGL